ncbi:hypothetical protein QWM81_22500 [Streptomyces ficellus]|uniref:Uncharacterized protein n=1 Tax=Streptomyces ficellus TaxID=1977088 RepID=A0ABT7ZB79_9ACTN|nr:hypothetical protein [Streptomyces ficellus]MDN3296766.1 hypothetical protein [Streptomyces ficellus]
MRRAGSVVAVATALTLGSAGQGWASSTSSGDITASWGDRARIEVTWNDRNSLRGITLAVADQTCDERSFYVTLTIQTGAGGILSLGDKHNTGGCGTVAEHRGVRTTDASGIRRLSMTLCRRAAGMPDHCETRYITANPYAGL